MNEHECILCKHCVIEHYVPICLKRNEAITNPEAYLSCFEEGVTASNEFQLQRISNLCKSVLKFMDEKDNELNTIFLMDRIKEIKELCEENK